MQTIQSHEPDVQFDAPATKPAKKTQPKRRMARPPADTPDVGLPQASASNAAPAPSLTSKAAAVIAFLERAEGTTLAELIAATGWLPHTTRAALTGLRKKGHNIERSKRGEETCYRIIKAG